MSSILPVMAGVPHEIVRIRSARLLNQSVQCSKVNRMVQQEVLDRTFAALADGTRRRILLRLGQGPATIGELAEPLGMSLTGMRKHVHVLENAGLVTTAKVGRSRQCRLGAERLEDAMSWISFYQRLWERRLDGLDAYFTLKNAPETTTEKDTER
jgi:DNA-binding transcriptional ArsR family regulator